VTSRDAVLGRIRQALEGSAAPPPVPREYAATGGLAAGSDAVIDLLIDRLEDYRATVHRVGPGADPAAAVDAALGPASSVVVPAGLPDDLRAAAGDRTTVVDSPALTAAGLDRIDAVLTGARVAIAETGTIILDGSDDQGRRMITLVPDRHVVVLHADQVVHSVPEGLAALTPTAPLTMISGPSATSDIELSRVEGVHGPRILHVVIV
jgi:L-lactate dehydrogenase complex protein LldG